MCPTGTKSQRLSSEFRPAFDVLDTDHDGKISRDDLRTFYAGVPGGKKEDDEMIVTMMSVADSNKDGFVEYDEFERVLNRSKKGGGGGCVMEDVFKVMDRDGDGKVSHEDLQAYMNMAGFSATSQDIQAMIRLGGGDGDGVTYQGLLNILALHF